MPQVAFEPTILVFMRAKTIHALDHMGTVIVSEFNWILKYISYFPEQFILSYFAVCRIKLTDRGFLETPE
jgi:hypothetical protein